MNRRASAAPINSKSGRTPKSQGWDELVHSGPGTLMGQLLRRHWQPVAVASLVSPGRAVPIRIMGEDLTLYRGASGEPYIVGARCAHRLSLLHTGWVEDECIRCFYHGWKYDGTGQCVEMPAEDESFAEKVKITSYPAKEYAGLIYAFMGEGKPPVFPRKAELDREFGITYAYCFIWPCNWLQRLENSFDATHVSFVHRRTALGNKVSSDIPALLYEETEWGFRQIAERSPDNIRISEIAWPNCNHIVTPDGPRPSETPWTDVFNTFVPVDDEHTAQFSARSTPLRGDAINEYKEWAASSPRYDPANDSEKLFREAPYFEFHNSVQLVAAQDYVAQVGQGAIVDRSQE
ncbi:MAG: Rieske 2Fe-2S domain-containing protein, partial [Candidatus Latescibacteria bacterium]|nr:Rieske 2Fe-2S domain-containing protein [Candidatus Latescibacterota bacterium]